MLTPQPNGLQTKYEKKSCTSISILITGVVATVDKGFNKVIWAEEDAEV